MTNKIKVMVNGLPGNMATKVAEHICRQSDMELLPVSLAGSSCNACNIIKISSFHVVPVLPKAHLFVIKQLKSSSPYFIAVDFTHPSAVNKNAQMYCDLQIPFIMGTTGGDRELLLKIIEESKNYAVVAPNMAKQVVAFQAMMEYAAEKFSGVFSGYDLQINESHQSSKADTSGTAKAMVKYFNKLGVPFEEGKIYKERNKQAQRVRLGVPESHLNGHGYHTYFLRSDDGTAYFQFTHNINGRDIYALGALDAIRFLKQAVQLGSDERYCYSMIDVIKGFYKKR